jgi:hypothetical protein
VDIKAIHQHVENMRMRCSERDRDSYLVRMTRKGRLHEVFPSHFADDLQQMAIANTIDNVARDVSEQFAGLPSLVCSSGNMSSASDVSRATKRNKIASYYWDKSDLDRQNIDFCDATLAYAFGVYRVEPDFDLQCPRIRWSPSFDTYYYKDLWGRTKWCAQVKLETVLNLCAKYPHLDAFIGTKNGRRRSDSDTERVVTYDDENQSIVYLPDCNFTVLAQWQHNLGRCMVVIAERPGQEDMKRGQFDDSVVPMLVKHVMVQYQLNATDKAVNAPIAMPDDVTELPYGPDATIRTQNPQGVSRVRLDVPDDLFALGAQLDQAVKEGSRYPESRSGGTNASIITGKGVEALSGTMNTQIKTMQVVVGKALEEVTELCFMLDRKLWPTVQKKITGVLAGKPYEVTYTPGKDIGDSYTCKVSYGFASGQGPAQAIVAMLQLRGDKVISRDTFRRNLPFDLDSDEEQRQIDAEDLAAAAGQGLMGLTQAFGPMVMQNQDPMPVLRSMAKVIALRKKGVSMEDALVQAFTPPEQPEEEAAEPGAMQAPGEEQAEGAPPGPGGPELPQGVQPNGRLQGQAVGQQGMAPGGLPDVQNLMATLRGQGNPRMEATVSRRRVVGA